MVEMYPVRRYQPYSACVGAFLAVLCMFYQVEPGNYINLPSPTPFGDTSFYTHCPVGDGLVLGERKAPCFSRDANRVIWTMVVNVLYADLNDALAGVPLAARRDWWWYVKYSNGRVCGPAGWSWN